MPKFCAILWNSLSQRSETSKLPFTVIIPQPLEGEALQAHVTKLLSDHMQDVDKHFSNTMEQLEGVESTFTAKLDAKFQEVLARLPPPPPARAPPP
jgi:hypothetical protein